MPNEETKPNLEQKQKKVEKIEVIALDEDDLDFDNEDD